MNQANSNSHKSASLKTTRFLLSSICLVLLILQDQISRLPISAFNIDTQSAILHSGPSGSYFGYSVAEHKDRGVGWLLVGAPKAQTDQPKTKQSGAVYRCSPTNPKSCQQIPFDPNGPSTIRLGNELKQTDDKSYQWFGASLQSANDNGSFVACAPHYVYFSQNLKRRDPVGTCWVSRGSFSGFLEYSPCRINEQWGHNRLGSCQAGFSSAITKDGGRVIMGAPGAHVWQGQVFAHDLKTDLSLSTSSVNPHHEDDSYLGYSLALGRFSALASQTPIAPSRSGSPDSSDIAIGIPRGADISGKVMLVDRDMRFLFNLTGEQFGSRFGESMTVADVNGDSLDDLIVSAPHYFNHKERQVERGRVYVYLQTQRHELQLAQRIDGQQNGARFGYSLANCGDLNRDGFQDVAIGAPYGGPEGRGAVYIFMGHKSGLSAEPDQAIYAESLRGEAGQLRTFGFSLSAGIDFDGNQYPDLLVGDYKADRAILLRARPVVNATASLTFTPENFDLEQRNCTLNVPDPAFPGSTSTSVSCITVKYCLKYNGLNVDSKLPFVFDVKLDSENKGAPRLFFLEPEARSEQRNSTLLSKDVQLCKEFKAYITRQIRDKLTPLKVELDYNLAEYQGDIYDYTTNQPKLRPVLNKSHSNKLSKLASIQKHCGYDNVCVPDLKLSMYASQDKYIIGSNERLVLDITVKNNGEDAFESTLYLNMPMTINFIHIANRSRNEFPLCYGAKPDQTGTNILICDLGNPLVRNDALKFSIVTEPSRSGSFSQPDFTFVATVNSTNPEADDRHREDNTVAIGIPIEVEVKLIPSGKSDPNRLVYNVSTSSESSTAPWMTSQGRPKLAETDIGQEIYHTYQIQNRGPSTINDIAVALLWPYKNQDGQHLLYLVDEPLTNEKVVCKPAPAGAINPLQLKYIRGDSLTPTMPTITYSAQGPANNGYQARDRYKRQTSRRESSQSGGPSSVVDASVLDQQLLTCAPAQCTRFECNVFDLAYNEIATIRIRSRLFEDTLDHYSMQDFSISSRMVAQVKSLPYNVSSRSQPPLVYSVETLIHKSGLAVQDLLQEWWLLIPAILLGIILLALLVWCLKCLGFFDRKRPQKAPGATEREPLAPSMWNEYQYTPGDTAL